MTKVGHWPLSEDSGSTAYDYSGNENHGSVTGAGPSGTGTVDGPLGQTAYDFDGTDDYVDTNSGGLVNGSTSATVAGWGSNDSSLSIVRTGATTDENIGIGASNGNWACAVRDDSGNFNRISGPSATTEWAFVVGTWNEGTQKLYVNGIEVASATPGSNSLNSSTYDTWIGAVQDTDNTVANYTDGSIADVRVYDRALSPSEVAYLYEVSQSNWMQTGWR